MAIFMVIALRLIAVACLEAAIPCADTSAICPDDSMVLLQTSVQVHTSPQKAHEHEIVNDTATVTATGTSSNPLRTLWSSLAGVLGRELTEDVISGLATTYVGAAPPAANSRPFFYHLHISKAAGTSFVVDAGALFWNHGHNFVSREGCYHNAGYPHVDVAGVTMLVRNPRSLVLSQFNFVAFDSLTQNDRAVVQKVNLMFNRTLLPRDFGEWIETWLKLRRSGWAGNLTVPPQPFLADDEQERWCRDRLWLLYHLPPYGVPGMQQIWDEDEYPEYFGGGTFFQGLLMPFGTWSPMSFQTQRLTCTMPYDYSQGLDAAKAVRNLEDAYFSGVVEAYQTSVCLLYAKVAQTLPAFCDCTKPLLWATFNGTERNTADNIREPVQMMSPDELSPELLAAVDELVQEDWVVYRAAWDRLVRESREVERRFGTKILCDETMPL